MTAKDLIEKLNLQPHPEGGYYKETYRAATEMDVNGKARNVSTAIYYLLEDGNKSHFHRIKSDELWFFHTGQPLEVIYIKDGRAETILLGNDLSDGQVPQAMIPANTWFGSRIKGGKGFCLVSCTVAPGFDFEDFEVGKRKELLLQYSNLEEIIERFNGESGKFQLFLRN